MVDKNLYYTQSWNIAAWFMYKGIPLEFKITNENGITTFYYKRSIHTKKAIDEYNNNQELKDFIACYKKIKDMVNKDK